MYATAKIEASYFLGHNGRRYIAVRKEGIKVPHVWMGRGTCHAYDSAGVEEHVCSTGRFQSGGSWAGYAYLLADFGQYARVVYRELGIEYDGPGAGFEEFMMAHKAHVMLPLWEEEWEEEVVDMFDPQPFSEADDVLPSHSSRVSRRAA